MTARKLTQSAVGTGIGYSRKVVNNALSGVRKGSDVLEAIAAYLGIS
jgi:transcriptional regulator with XRE-family HTH domain